MCYTLPSVILYLCLLVVLRLQCVPCATSLIRDKRHSDADKVSCELPQHPKNGRWSILNGEGRPGDKIIEDSVVKFECDPDYKLSSRSSFLICDENWSLSKIPVCEKKCSPKHSTPTTFLKCEDKYGQEVACDQAVDGTYLSYSCAPYYETPLGYKKTILCVEGTWNFPNPVCQPVCGKKIEKDTIKLVVGGTVKEKREYPWIVALYKKIKDDFIIICGGSLVSQRIIVTAAHCVANDFGDRLPPEEFLVAAGKFYYGYKDTRDEGVQYSEVARIVVHSGYKGASQRFLADIALLVTKDLIGINQAVQPVCYQDVASIHLQPGKVGVVAGWGKTETGDHPDQLTTLEIPFKHQMTCGQELPSDWAERFNTNDKICAGFINQTKSLCTGDSGSGFYFLNPEDNRYYIHGVVSIAPAEMGECNPQQNSLFTNVAHYYDFVDREATKQYAEQCSLPPYPQNGKWTILNQNKKPGDIVPSNTILKVECNEGFELSSNNALVDCESAFALPQCELLCPKLSFPEGTTYKCNNKAGEEINCAKAVHGSSLTYSCPEGYRLPPGGETVRVCKKGSWGQFKPECIEDNGMRETIAPGEKILVCSYDSSSAYDKVFPEDLNTTLCTHIVYTHISLWEKGEVKVNNDSIELDKNQKGLYRRFTELKKKNKNLKILLSIGSTSGKDASIFADVASGESKRTAFIYSALYFIETYNFDGMNIEWFYPEKKDEDNYVQLLRDFRDKCNERGWLLTATIRAYPDDTGYDGSTMSKILDFIIVRTYNFYGPWNVYTGQSSALYPSSLETPWEKSHLNIDAAMKNWMRAGIPKNKLVLSIAFDGASFTLWSRFLNFFHAPISGSGIGQGFPRYNEICKLKGWTTVRDDEQVSVYAYDGDDWVGYDDKDTVRTKATYAKENGFLGVNVWPVDGDDVYGKCGTKQILLKHVNAGLRANPAFIED